MSVCRFPFASLSLLLGGLLLVGLLPTSASAQTPTTTIQNGNDDTRLQLNHDGGLYVPGTFRPTAPADSIPATGAGTRLMWYPAKGAFRAGRVGDFQDGTQWDASKVGNYSVAFGVDTEASGRVATAMGDATTASGNVATAMNFATEASGRFATAMGALTEAATETSLSIGEYNSANTSADNTLFVAGNGSVDDDRSDALVLKQDGDLAVGPSDPQDLRLHVTKDKPNAGVSDTPGANMVLFENTNDGTRPDVLGLQAGPTDPGSGVTYVSFYQRDGTTIGGIEGNGSGGVNYATSGSDYAEELPVSGDAPALEPTDLVGVRGGEVHLSTERADRVMIASDQPAVTGNTTPSTETDDARRVAVAFVGQVPVRLRGEASVGDLVVASGQDDGTAQAVSPGDYRRAEHGPIAGQAWSTTTSDGVSTVTVAVGLGQSGVVAERMQAQQEQITDLKAANEKIRAQNEQIKDRLAALEAAQTRPAAAGIVGPWGLTVLLALGIGGLVGAALLRSVRS